MTRNETLKKRLRFGEAIVAAGHVDRDIVERALDIQRKRDAIGESHKLLGLIMLEMGAISNEQLIQTLKYMQKASRNLPRVTGS
jgi:hypothetical protein